ncbi:MAG: protein kinase [Polyangiaceae bacterium]
MSSDARPDKELPPVYVSESIPVGGAHEVKPDEAAKEKIPTPAHLRVYKEFGRGGMGHVHPATDRNLLRHVALKRLDKSLDGERFYVEGFIAEAQIAGQLEHPNIVPVHELSVENGVPFFTMKLVQGVSLDGWYRKHPIGTPERMTQGLEIFLKICDAVGYAHHRGVIHRDLKPANVMVGDFGQVYLMDWGLSRLTRTQPASGQNSQMNAPGAVGTPDYMAPEQAKGDPTIMDERCDIFGLGAMLYELVSGKRPYGDHPDARVILERALKGEIRSIDEVAQKVGISRRMRTILAKAIAIDPKERYQTVEELRRDVHDFLLGGLHLPRKLFEPGTVIMREGDPGDAAYMIVSGKCRAYRNVDNQEETLAIMEPGEVFGEMALLLEEPRAASVVAVDRVVVLVLDKNTMNEGLGLEGWTGALVRALANRFRNLEQQVRVSGLRRG